MKHFFYTLILASGWLLSSCETEDENETGQNSDLVDQEDDRVIDRFPSIGQDDVDGGATIWIELNDSTSLAGEVRAELFEFDYSDSVWLDWSGVQPHMGNILYTSTNRTGSKIYFQVNSRSDNTFKPDAFLEGHQYLIHVFSDEDNFKIWWTFQTISESVRFLLADTLTAEGIQTTGKTVYLKLVDVIENENTLDFGAITDPAVYWTKATFRNDSVSQLLNGETDWAHFSVSDIAQGTYSIWAFIDMNGNSIGDGTATPDAGDYFKGVEGFEFYSQEKVDEWTHLVNELEWQVYED